LTVDAPAEGILDPLVSKLWGLKYAVHAANTVLKVDEIIMSKPAGGPRAPQGPGGDHDDD
jgi:T-complex protein 1 subunit theta